MSSWVKDATKRQTKIGSFQPGWWKEHWMRLAAFIQDHPRIAIVACAIVGLVLGVGVYVVGGSNKPARMTLKQSWRLLCFQVLGGEQEVPRAIDIYDELLVLHDDRYDRLDIAAVSLYVTATSFQDLLGEFVRVRKGRVRILILDPRLSQRDEREFER